jgi:predicted aconitase with swiveling domain
MRTAAVVVEEEEEVVAAGAVVDPIIKNKVQMHPVITMLAVPINRDVVTVPRNGKT